MVDDREYHCSPRCIWKLIQVAYRHSVEPIPDASFLTLRNSTGNLSKLIFFIWRKSDIFAAYFQPGADQYSMKKAGVILLSLTVHFSVMAQIIPQGHNLEEYMAQNVRSFRTVYQPDSNSIVDSELVIFKKEFNRMGQLLTKYQLFLWEAVSYSYTSTYLYSESGQLIEERKVQKILNLNERDEDYIHLFGDEPLSQRYFYYYNSEGHMSKMDVFNYTNEFSDSLISQTVQYEYEDGLKIKEQSTSPDEKVFNRNYQILYEYDSSGNLITKTRTFGKELSLRRTTSYWYNEHKQIIEEKTLDESFPHNNSHFKYTYNPEGRIYQKSVYNSEEEDFELLTTYEYDGHGNAIQGDRDVTYEYNNKGLITSESWIDPSTEERFIFLTGYEYF